MSKVTNARDALADFGRGMETYCLTFGQFSLMDAVEAILEKTGPADVALSTWTAGGADLSRSAEHLHNGHIRSMRFVCDCSFGQRQPGYLAKLRELFGDDAIRTTRTHARIRGADKRFVAGCGAHVDEPEREPEVGVDRGLG